MGAKHLAQRGVEQVRAGVIAADCVAADAVDNSAHMVAHSERLLQQGLVGTHALHGQNAAKDLCNSGISI
jgi:hypothetical protein